MEVTILSATHSGQLEIAGKELGCAVLEDGTRVLTATAIYKAFGRSRRGKDRDDQGRALLPRFVEAKSLKPFIDAAFDGGQQDLTISYRSKIGGNTYEGYKAEILPILCEAILQANDSGEISEQQRDLVDASSILIRSFAKVGIIALIDEATGYQEEREFNELQKILSMYISEELLPFVKTFHDEFYIQMFRLRGWDYRGKYKTPYAGVLTNYLVYERLPIGVLDELRRLNPILRDRGYRRHRLYQRLSREQGYRHLQTQIATVTTMMRGFDNWNEFDKAFRRAYGITEPLLSEDDIFLSEP